MEASGEAEAVWATDGTVETVEAAWLDSLTEIIDWLLENWDSLAKLILFIIGLF